MKNINYPLLACILAFTIGMAAGAWLRQDDIEASIKYTGGFQWHAGQAYDCVTR